jgi:alanyl-tRNA synthetase
MKSAEIRQRFLDYFARQGHEVVASSSLVPGNDPTLLFTNAGMVQFKDVFLGAEHRPYSRAASSQRCVRAGGKHNDLENVGYTARHHTFFEMLGNFSFGDYFKRDAIRFAWEFLTEEMQLPPEKLWVTVHVSDDEAEAIWKDEIGIDPERFSKLDEDNFWQMGDTGPCGPSSEIFYDHGEDVPGGPPGSENDDLDRYIEIWNLVFMQYERSADGELTPLPKPSVDTGMGLERISAVMQNVHNNYDIDLFRNLLAAIDNVVGDSGTEVMSRRVIADHIRSCAFLVVDGVVPSNEGRGYVLRRIIRRAIRHGHKLGMQEPFFHKLVAALVNEMGEAFPELAKASERVANTLLAEEEQFARTLDNGMKVLEESLAGLSEDVIPGELIFRLYDTYGFPVDLTNDIARERNLQLDMEGYDECMKQQQETARAAGKFSVDYTDTLQLEGETEFTGYELLQDNVTVEALVLEGELVESMQAGQQGSVVTDKTPFYAESGGQVGDQGLLKASGVEFVVRDTQKAGDSFIHVGEVVAGEIKPGENLTAEVDASRRLATAKNHSATHLLHAALRASLGDHVQQKGSLVDADRLRFDFSHFEALQGDEVTAIEQLVNQHVQAATEVNTRVTSMEEAVADGAMALFGEKYGDSVRVLAMGADRFSVELCGGTHVSNTGDIGVFRILSESGVAAGVRRIEACTGESALQSWNDQISGIEKANAEALKVNLELAGKLGDVPLAVSSEAELSPQGVDVDTGVEAARLVARYSARLKAFEDIESALADDRKKLDKEKKRQASAQAASSGVELADQAREKGGVHYLVAELEGADANSLRTTADSLRSKLGSSVVFLAAAGDGKVSLVAGVSKDCTDKVKAGDLMKAVAPLVGGKGGGRPDMAQGGGSEPDKLPEAVAAAWEWLENTL